MCAFLSTKVVDVVPDLFELFSHVTGVRFLTRTVQ